MSDRSSGRPNPETPAGKTDQQQDELFDKDFLTESDRDFLAELDRVLAADMPPLAEPPSPPPAPGLTRTAPIPAELDSQPEYQAPPARQELPPLNLGEDDAIDELDIHLAPPQELDWDAPPKEDWNLDAPQDHAGPISEPPEDGGHKSIWDDADDTVLVSISPAATALAASVPLGEDSARPLPPPPDDDRADEDPGETPSASLESVAMPAVPAPVQAAASTPSASQRLGLVGVGLAALVSLGLGGGSLFSLNGLEQRIAGIDATLAARPVANPAPSPAPAPQDNSGELARRVDRLDQEVARLDGQLPALNQSTLDAKAAATNAQTGLEQRLAAQEQGSREELKKLSSQIGQLSAQLDATQGQLKTAQERLEAASRQLAQTEADIKAKVTAQKAPPKPAPVSNKAVPEPNSVAEPPKPDPPKTIASQEGTPIPVAAAEPASVPVTEPTGAPAASSAAEQITGEQPGAEPRKPGWSLHLASFPGADSAQKETARLEAYGIKSEIRSVSKGKKSWYRVSVRGFDDYQSAKSYKEQLGRIPGVNSAWISRD